jgi:hypothetical protein
MPDLVVLKNPREAEVKELYPPVQFIDGKSM